MARVLISFLGTGRIKNGVSKREYEPAKYEIEGEPYEETFISKALDKYYSFDKIFIIGTLKSMWEEVYRSYTDEDSFNENMYFNLGEKISTYNQNTQIKYSKDIYSLFNNNKKIIPIVIKYGLNTEELNFNIERILEIEINLSNGDEIYFDITHGFRSLPLLLMNVIYYLTDVSNKKLKVKKITYAMFEAQINGTTPVVELDIINELHENIKAAYEFNTYGNAYLFSKLIENTNKSMSKILLDFSHSKGLNHIYDLKNKINQFRSFQYNALTPVQRLTIPKTVLDFVRRFDKAKKDSHYQFEIARWMFDNKEFGASSIALIESLITKVCELENIEADKKENRDFAKIMINFSGKSVKNIKNEIKKIRLSSSCSKDRLLKSTQYSLFHAVWGEANKIRKSVSHSIGTKLSVNKMVQDIEKYIQQSESLIYN